MASATRFALERRWLAAAALALALPASLAGCRPGPASSPDAAGSADSLAQLQSEARALEARLGADAYVAPEMEVLIKSLEALPYDEARRLALELTAKRKAGLEARGEVKLARPEWEARPPDYGPRRMAGEAPKASASARERIAALHVGSPRAELLAAYGSCLVRQTWFLGRNGGPTTELFHVAPDCRGQLEPRVYQVARDAIASISAGTLDGIMEGSGGHDGRPQQAGPSGPVSMPDDPSGTPSEGPPAR